MFDSINQEQQLYVLRHDGGYSGLGFDYAYQLAVKIHLWLVDNGVVIAGPTASLIGTEDGYNDYRRLVDAGAELNRRTNRRCPVELTPQLVGLEGKKVRVIDRSGETRTFTVGRSGGWMPIHLEIEKPRDIGGCSVYGAPFAKVDVLNRVGKRKRS